MKRAASLVVAALIAGGLHATAQQPATATARDLVGTWTLVSTEQDVDGPKPTAAGMVRSSPGSAPHRAPR
jgi:hypothetical protein